MLWLLLTIIGGLIGLTVITFALFIGLFLFVQYLQRNPTKSSTNSFDLLTSLSSHQTFLYMLHFGWKVPFYRLKEMMFYGKSWPRRVASRLPHHLAIIMDGNRRYARALQLSSVAIGHEQGADKLREMLEWFAVNIPELKEITVWALSTDNLVNRSKREIDQLWQLVEHYLPKLAASKEIQRQQVRIRVIGERELLPSSIIEVIEDIEKRTAHYDRLTVNVALCYGGQEEIKSVVKAGHNLDELDRHMYTLTPPDLIFRSGGEKRLSGFMMWQSKHAELSFCSQLWPALDKVHILDALNDFAQRQRRYGY